MSIDPEIPKRIATWSAISHNRVSMGGFLYSRSKATSFGSLVVIVSVIYW